MATTYIGIIPGSRQADERFQDTLNRVYRETHLVSSTADSNPVEVYATAGLPQFNDAYGPDPSAIVKSRRIADTNKTRTLWMVEIEFNNIIEVEQEDEEPQDDNDPQISVNGDISWTYEMVPEVMTVDERGKPVATTAGEPFDVPPNKMVAISVLTWSRWTLSFGGGLEQQFWINNCNSDSWNGAAPYQALIAGITAYRQFIKGFLYWRVTDTIKYHPRDWKLRLPNKGNYKRTLAAAGFDTEHFVDTKLKRNRMGWLTEDGFGESPTPTTVEFEPFKTLDFAVRYGN